MKLGVLVSGRGTNLRNLIDREFEVVAVATNRAGCPGAQLALERGIPLGVFAQKRFASAAERDTAMAAWLVSRGVELVVAAGWDRVLTGAFVSAFPNRILNIHPSLLPAFAGGMDAVDAGPILLQAAVPVLDGDTVESLHARIQREEHRILPEAIRLMQANAEARAGLG